jgi:uncharacterized protein
MTMPPRAVVIPNGDITLEGSLHLPEGSGPFATVVVCHPHPRYGGDMYSNVVMAAVHGLNDNGVAALRFNFRGVGRSGGSHDDGKGEQDDVRAALSYAGSLPETDVSRVGLAGYSFGAMMAAAVAGPELPALALIALPLHAGVDAHAGLSAYGNSLLLLAGDHDHVCPDSALREMAASLPGPVDTRIVAGTDHFWAGYEGEIADAVGGFFAEHLTDGDRSHDSP